MSLVIHNLVDVMPFFGGIQEWNKEFMVERLKLDRTIGATVRVCGYCAHAATRKTD